MKLKSKTTIVLLLATVIILTLATRQPQVQWRISVLKLKLSGDLPPNLTWGKLCRGMTPYSTNKLLWLYYNCLGEESLVSYQGFELDSNGICSTLWDTPIGSLWSNCEQLCWVKWFLKEQLEEKVYDCFDPAKVKPGDVVIDVGAHIGTFTRFALERGARLVIAFEPDQHNIMYFKKNFEKEIRSKKVILIEAAAWDSPGTLKFIAMEGTSSASKVNNAGEIEVPAVTIDDTVKRLELDRVDFIKMDIEGAERNAVAGASKTISHSRPRMALSIYHLEDDPDVIPALVLDAYQDYKIEQTKKVAFFFE